MNKKSIAIATLIIVVIALFGIKAYNTYNNKTTTDLPVVSENKNPTTTATPTPKDYSKVALPKSDANDENSIVIDEKAQPTVSPEEVAAVEKAEAEKGREIEQTPEEIAETNKKIEDAKKAAEKNPDIQKIDEQPVAVETPAPTPTKDSGGYMYSKDQAVKAFAAEWKKLMDADDFNYTYALEEAKQSPDFSQGKFDSNVQLMMTNPYSSKVLPSFFDDYRKDGDIGILVGQCAGWLMLGGDDAKIAPRTN